MSDCLSRFEENCFQGTIPADEIYTNIRSSLDDIPFSLHFPSAYGHVCFPARTPQALDPYAACGRSLLPSSSAGFASPRTTGISECASAWSFLPSRPVFVHPTISRCDRGVPEILRPGMKRNGRVTTAEDLILALMVAMMIIIIEKTRQGNDHPRTSRSIGRCVTLV